MSSHHDPSKSAAERLHELQLRQGELERQNQELRRAQAEQDASRARYFDLYDQAPIGYCTISEPGLIIEANLVAATQLGLPRDTLPGQTFIQFIVNEDQDSYHLYRRQLSEAGGPQTCELRLVKTNGSTFWAHLAMTVANANGAPVCRIVLSDISERKRIEDIQLFLSQNEPGDACENFFQGLARHLAQSLGMDYVCIDRLLGDGAVAKTLAIYHDGKFKDNVTYSLKDTPGSDVLGKGTCCFAKDACHLFPQHAVLQELQAESYAGTALRSSSGLPIGLIAVIGQKTLENQLQAETILKLVAARAADELERQQAEEALRESELQYRTLADSGQALIWTSGLDKKRIRDRH